jgi:galactose mutarotase-like enzyme
MDYFLENNDLKVTINSKGAELTSIKGKRSQREYLWQGDPQVWGRHAPVLFPIVGKLRNNQYQYNEKIYTLSQHGFARDKAFKCIEHSSTFIHFQLDADPDSLKVFPFEFELHICYTLSRQDVEVRYKVINIDTKDMYFSIGAHPGFNIPFLPGEKFEDYYLEFSHKENLERLLLDNGLFNGKKELVIENHHILPFTEELFNKDALVFENIKSHFVTIKNTKNPFQISVFMEGFPYLGVWTKMPDKKFVCIEPWYGLADYTKSIGFLEDKKGIIKLSPAERFQCQFEIGIDRHKD